jgi:hypothetical protein
VGTRLGIRLEIDHLVVFAGKPGGTDQADKAGSMANG